MNLLIAIHIAHWRLHGTTLAPLELHEVMYTAELGVITAGFILMAAALVSVLIFGRFFCSWGCHLLALQDGADWLLRRAGLRPRFLRSRTLALVPMGAFAYMFVWPHVARWLGHQWPGLLPLVGTRPEPHYFRVLTDNEGWASFTTADFWRNLPGPGITVLTFATCGLGIVLLLGSRSFCRYACPYGAVFSLADRMAPGRIVLRGPCDGCGLCTAACPSHLRVHEEIAREHKVVDGACIRGMSCLGACPTGALAFGFGRPPFIDGLRRMFRRGGARRMTRDPAGGTRRHELTWTEELLVGAVCFATVVVFRGLYDLVPFLMSLGLGAVMAAIALSSFRLATRPDVALGTRSLRRAGRLRPAGVAYAVLGLLTLLFFLHSGWIRWHEEHGNRQFREVEAMAMAAAPTELLASARYHLEVLDRWGLVQPPDLDRKLASLYLVAGPPSLAERRLLRVLRREPDDTGARLALGELLADQGRHAEAEAAFRVALRHAPDLARAHRDLGVALELQGRYDEARMGYTRAIQLDPADSQARNDLERLGGPTRREGVRGGAP